MNKIVNFSLNRYGSVYVFNSGLNDIKGKYVKSASQIEVEEINVNKLVRNTVQVVLALNGEARTLTEGKDYQIVPYETEGMWSRYIYRFEDSLFAQDGTYKLMLYSVDVAGNKNENTDLSKAAEIQFGVDNTAPIIIPLNLESGMVYNENTRQAIISIADNFVLDLVKVFVNGKEVDFTISEDKLTFAIPQMERTQNIRIVAKDIAGNESVYEMSGLLITTNLLIRWKHNTPLIIGVVGGAVILLGVAIAAPILFATRKRQRPFH